MTDVFEQIKQEYNSINPQLKDELFSGYEYFKATYSPEILQSLSGEQLLDKLFLGKGNNENLCYYLEKDKRCKAYGGIGGGNSAKFGLYYSKNKNSWVRGKGKSVQELSLDEAIKEGSEKRDIIVKACEYISDMDFKTIDDYEKLEEFKDENPFIKNVWIRKYLHMVFPDYFPAWYSEQMLEAIIRYYGEKPKEGLFVKAGQVTLIARKCNIPLIVFANLKTNRTIIEAVKVKDFDDDGGEVQDTNVKEKNSKKDTKMRNIPLNQILYGPPGTGKTYNTIIEAMKIITFEELFRDWFLKVYCLTNKVDSKDKVLGDYIKTLKKINEEFLVNDNIFMYHDLEEFIQLKNNILNSKYIIEDTTKNNKNSYYQHGLKRYEEFLNWLSNDKYNKIREKFEEYKSLGRIEFITFHQSYSYEEFIEGIKPLVSDDTKELEYEVKPGIFKRICEKASKPIVEKNKWDIDSGVSIWKVSLGGTYDNPIRKDCFKNDRIRIGWDAYGENYEDKATEGKRPLDAFYQKMKKGDIVLSCYTNRIIDGIGIVEGDPIFDSSLSEYKRTRKVNWVVKDIKEDIYEINDNKTMTLSTVYNLGIPLEKVIAILHKYNTQAPITKENDQRFVLVIDEINRGNISKIFGELITLIEDDKRANLSVRLPYSSKTFTVPKNLYIIGTMNTADRSIATIDIALRRRFTFIPKMPDVDLVPDRFSMKEAFKNLNKKIRILLDEDHQIGHSYFMNVESIIDLKEVWANKIIPLLNEYFYGDWTKLDLLIPGFIITDKINDRELEDEIGENCYYRFNEPFSLSDDDFIRATLGLKIETAAA